MTRRKNNYGSKSFAAVHPELNNRSRKKICKHKSDDLYYRNEGCSLPLLPQVDEVWGDITAPFAKVGAILWKDLKTIQKEMPEFEWYQMVSLMPSDSSWKPGCLNDEVINSHY